MARTRAITVPLPALPHLESGQPQIPLVALGDAPALSNTGQALELVDPAGELLALGIVDSENDVFRILSRSATDQLDDAFLLRRARRAIALRQSLGLLATPPEPARGAFRLVHGEGDGLSGFLVDAFGDYLIQYVLARGLKEWGRRLAEALRQAAAELDLRAAGGRPWPLGVLQKVRDRAAARPGKPSQATVCGEEPPEKLIAEEAGVPFEIHPLAGLNVGLFTDMREHRWRIGRFARGRRVLNTFAYTCSLSVAAALQGAERVTSVDLSSGVLKWGQENFRLAGIDPDRHVFTAQDTGRFLEEAAARRETFDLVVLDPPTYSAARAAGWSMRRDLDTLIARALAVLAPGGTLWMSSNSHQLGDAAIESGLAEGARKAGRELDLLEIGGLPPDHPTPLAFRDGRYLKLRVLRAD